MRLTPQSSATDDGVIGPMVPFERIACRGEKASAAVTRSSTSSSTPPAGSPPGNSAYTAAKHPLGRPGTAQEVANLTTTLLTDKASFMTGPYVLVRDDHPAWGTKEATQNHFSTRSSRATRGRLEDIREPRVLLLG